MNTLKLDPRLTAEQAAPLRDSLLSQRGAPLALDAGEVERLGGQCFQVLAAARKTWAADGHPLTFAQPSPAFAAGAAALAGQFGVPASSVIPVGVGMAAPVAPNTDEAGRAKNRRVEIVAM